MIRSISGDPLNGYEPTSEQYRLEDVSLDVPIVPGTFYAIGSNYRDHVLGIASSRGRVPKFYDTPRVGYRANSALVAHEDAIVKPKDAGPRFEYASALNDLVSGNVDLTIDKHEHRLAVGAAGKIARVGRSRSP